MTPAERSRPSIAVVLPNHNDARYLTAALRSILEQSSPPEEVVVIDDQSTDESVPLLRKLLAGRPSVRLIESPVNLGVYGAVQEGMKHVRSDYVFFFAANDFVLPGMFEHARRCLADAPQAGLWSAMAWIVGEDGRPLRLHASPVVALADAYLDPARCLRLAKRLGNWFTGTTLIYQRRALEEAGGFNPVYMGMSDLFTALVIAARHGAVYSPAPYAAIRDHAGSYSLKTLSDPAALDKMLARMAEDGRRAAPELFTPDFVERMARRLQATSVSRTRGATLGEIAARRRSGALAAVARLPGARLRSTLAGLVLRPFDVLPTLFYRLLGWLYVRSRVRWKAP